MSCPSAGDREVGRATRLNADDSDFPRLDVSLAEPPSDLPGICGPVTRRCPYPTRRAEDDARIWFTRAVHMAHAAIPIASQTWPASTRRPARSYRAHPAGAVAGPRADPLGRGVCPRVGLHRRCPGRAPRSANPQLRHARRDGTATQSWVGPPNKRRTPPLGLGWLQGGVSDDERPLCFRLL